MALKHARASVGVAAVRLDSQDDNQAGKGVVARNRGTESVYVGAEDVTTATGFELAPGEHVSLDLDPGESAWAIAASGSHRVDCIHLGVQ